MKVFYTGTEILSFDEILRGAIIDLKKGIKFDYSKNSSAP